MSLTQETAARRFQILRHNSITYNFNIIVNRDNYFGLAEIVFYLDNLNFDGPLELDFKGSLVEEVIINSIKVQPETN